MNQKSENTEATETASEIASKTSAAISGAIKVPMAQADMAIGLLGGSFNPPHGGHRHISVLALRRLGLSRVWWLVSPGNPLKDKSELWPLEKRLSQCLEVSDHPRIDVTAFERDRASVYTIDTIRYLQERFPETRFVWLMGADNLAQFHEWRSWKEIFESLPVVVVDRPSFRYRALSSQAAHYYDWCYLESANLKDFAFLQPPVWTFMTIPLSDKSSTAIREKHRKTGSL